MSRTCWLLATAVLALGPASLAAQTTGQIVGTVVSRQDSTPVAGAEVLIAGTDLRAVTDDEGQFVLIGVTPGLHTLTARAIGYTALELREVRVRAGVSARVTVALSPATVLEPITVEVEARPLLTPDVTASRQVVARDELATTPIESIEQALELRTGISDGHFRGGRLGQETFVIDGIDVKNQFSASRDGAAFQLAPSAVQEVSVLTSGWSADQASAVSGVVNLVTRSGPTDAWFGRTEFLSDDWAPDGLRRGYARLGLTAGGPLAGETTLFADLLLIGQADRDPRAEGLTCLDVPFPCPVERTIIPHQEGDRYFLFGKLDVPLSDQLDFILSLNRNRDQHELYSTRFKYALPDYLAERQTATLLTGAVRGAFQPHGARAVLGTARLAVGRVDRFLGVLTPDQPARLGRFRIGDYRFRGEDFATTDPEAQIASGATIPGYLAPSDSGLASPYGIFGADLFVTDGTSGVAEWSRSEFANAQAELQMLVSPQHDLKIGGDLKLYHIESYQHVAGGLAGAAPNYVEFYPVVAAAYLHNTLHAFEAATIDLGVRLEAFQPRLEAPTDRRDLTAPTATTGWQVLVHPRIGFAMPLSAIGVDRAAIRWNFGRFTQPPDFQFFFDQALDDSLNTAVRRQGNPNLGFERAIQYEGAFDYLLTDDLVLRITGFFKDLSGLTTSGITVGTRAETFTNLDFGRVQGAEVKLEARLPGARRLELGYALQEAFGVVSTAFDSAADTTGALQELEIPLQFDRRHAIDLNALWPVAGFHVAVGASIGSGFPVPGAAERRLPWSANVSARLTRDWRLGSRTLRVTAEGRNLLGLDNLVAARAGGGVLPDVQGLESRAAQETSAATPIPRESPLYLPGFDVDEDGFLSALEQREARRAALLDFNEPTLLYGEARQIRVGVELIF